MRVPVPGLPGPDSITGARTPSEQRQSPWPKNVHSKETKEDRIVSEIQKTIDEPYRKYVKPCPVNPQPGHKGVKLARFDLLPYDALWQVAIIFGIGANKYAARNWERGYDWSKSFGAVQRHLALWWQGEDKDLETERSHLAHAVCSLLFLMAFQLRGVGTDDRTKQVTDMTADVTNPEDIEAARKEIENEKD